MRTHEEASKLMADQYLAIGIDFGTTYVMMRL
jgi:hypothetical protein